MSEEYLAQQNKLRTRAKAWRDGVNYPRYRELLKKMGAREILGMDQPIRIRHLSTFVGSCIVGTDRNNSVVNPHFESHDIEGLFICDGSVVPRAASQGYAGTVATVALFAASRIVDRHFKRG